MIFMWGAFKSAKPKMRYSYRRNDWVCRVGGLSGVGSTMHQAHSRFLQCLIYAEELDRAGRLCPGAEIQFGDWMELNSHF